MQTQWNLLPTTILQNTYQNENLEENKDGEELPILIE